MTKEEIQKNSEHWYSKYKDLERENRLLGERCNQLLKDKGDLTDKAKSLEEENNKLLDVINNQDVKIADLEKQIEKMKCCGNCRFNYCERSSERIDKDGNRTFHCWNEKKEKYCDVGKNGKYQCWEIEK